MQIMMCVSQTEKRKNVAMGICQCKKRTSLFCFVHKRAVCEVCTLSGHYEVFTLRFSRFSRFLLRVLTASVRHQVLRGLAEGFQLWTCSVRHLSERSGEKRHASSSMFWFVLCSATPLKRFPLHNTSRRCIECECECHCLTPHRHLPQRMHSNFWR
jgi:hypothetical protein